MSDAHEADADEVSLPVKRTEGDTLEDRMTGNAYGNILPARYLRKDADGNLVESQDDLFPRVAKNIALAEAVYEAEKQGVELTVTPEQLKPDHPRRDELAAEVFGKGTTAEDDEETTLSIYNVNKFAYETVVPELPEDIRDHVTSVRDEFEDLMGQLSFVPNSPTLMNAGDELQQLSACFVDSPGDDITDIHQTAKEAAEVFQSGGGMGYAFWRLRPYGDAVGSTGGIASGPITFMRTYDQMCETIAQGGARRGAQMGVMRVSHPDVIQFIHSKNKDVSLANTLRLNDPDDYTHTSFKDALEEARELIDDDGRVPKHLRNAAEGHLSNFNISVGVTDDFMDALYNDEEFVFTNPRTEEPHVATEHTEEMYDMFGLGDYVTPGEVLSIPAKVLWDRIVDGAWENGEPGIIYLERVNKEHSFDVEKHPDHRILATNPCGEQPLEEYEACNLGHINLSTLADLDAPDWRVWYDENGDNYGSLSEAVDAFLREGIDWEEFDYRIEYGTRFLENVVTMSDFPVEKIEQKVRDMRKIGLGVMGLAQLYIQLGVRYGSDEGNEIAKQLMTHINHESKWASHELAEERGSFNDWSDSKYANPTDYSEWFEGQTGLDAQKWKDGFAVRNHNTTTIAPTGTTSMVGNTTGGCEPIYNVAYYKNVSDDVQGDEMLVEFDDYFLRTLEANDIDVEAVQAGGPEPDGEQRILRRRGTRHRPGRHRRTVRRDRRPHRQATRRGAVCLPEGRGLGHQQDVQLPQLRQQGGYGRSVPLHLRPRRQGRHGLPRRHALEAGAHHAGRQRRIRGRGGSGRNHRRTDRNRVRRRRSLHRERGSPGQTRLRTRRPSGRRRHRRRVRQGTTAPRRAPRRDPAHRHGLRQDVRQHQRGRERRTVRVVRHHRQLRRVHQLLHRSAGEGHQLRAA